MKLLSWALLIFLMTQFSTNAEPLRFVSNEKLAEQVVAAAVLTEIYQKAGLSMTVTPLPPARASVEATRGDHDGEVARIDSYGSRFPSMIQIRPAYYQLTTSAFALKGSNVSVKTRTDLAKYRVAIINGVAHSADAVAGLKGIDRVPDADSMFKMLIAGRVDIVLDTGINGAYEIQKLGLDNVAEVGVLAKLDLFHYVHEKNRSLAPLLEATIAKMAKSGDLSKLIAKAEQDFLAKKVVP